MIRSLLWLAVCSTLWLSPTASMARSPDAALAAAERAFASGRHRKALRLLPKLSPAHRLARRATTLRAYAHYKLAQHEQAARLLDAMANTTPLAGEAALLRAMIAVARSDWTRAAREIATVLAGNNAVLRGHAEVLRQRVNSELAAEREALRLAEEKRRESERVARLRETLARVKAHLEAGRLARAEAALKEVEALDPAQGQLETRYYLGYLAYKRGKHQLAQRQLRAALAIEPGDAWARYMLALAIDGAGNTRRANELLGALARGDNAEVRRVAKRALKRIARRDQPRGPRRGLWAGIELGSGVDSNPAYLDETPVGETAIALQAGLDLGYRLPLGRSLTLDTTLALVERTYVAGGGGDAHHTEPRAGLGVEIGNRRARLRGSYGFSLVLYDHRALLSSHVGELAGWLRVHQGKTTSVDAGLIGWIGPRVVHDAAYDYFAALRAGGAARLRLLRRWLQLEIGYGVTRDWATPVVTTFASSGMGSGRKGIAETWTFSGTGNGSRDGSSGDGTRTGDGSGSGTSDGTGDGSGKGGGTGQTYETTYETDYSLVEHGPDLGLTIELPWRLVFRGSVNLRWRRFNSGDSATRSDTGATDQLDPRRDVRLAIAVELERPLPARLALVLRAQSLDNWSTVETTDLDRNYRRRLAELALRWTWR